MRDLGARSRRPLIVEVAVAPPFFRLGPFVRNDGRGFVPLVHLDALGVELGLLEVERGLGGFAGGDALRTRIAEAHDPGGHRILGAKYAETGVQRCIVEPRLVGALYDLLTDGSPLLRIAFQKLRASPTLDGVGDFPT